jgi:hypothetical protein
LSAGQRVAAGTLDRVIVKAYLDGHHTDLETLAELFPAGETRVGRDDDGFYLTAADIENRRAGVPCYDVAPVVLQRVNGLARVMRSGYRPVRLSGRYQEGERRLQVVHAGCSEIRVQAMPVTILINGQSAASAPPPGPRYAATASSDADAAEALAIIGQPEPPNWVELYKVYEIIEHTGLLKATMGAAGVSANQLSLFTRTACHPAAGGPDARHGRSRQDPPKHAMPIAKARDLISSLVRAWMDLDATAEPAGPPR